MQQLFSGKQIFMESLLAQGVHHIFGNPGTTELPIIESLHDYPQLRYIMALQEAAAVSMADAYAHATGNVAVVNLHVAPGLGNGLGSVYNAWEGETPLLVTAGQQDRRLRLREPLLSHDLVAMAAPLVKWSVEATHADEMPLIMHRAFQTAREAPSGPVFVSLPMDVMESRTSYPPLTPSRLYPRAAPDPQGLAQASELLLGAERPTIVFGDKVASAGAMGALVKLAETLGAPVYAEILPARLSFPNQHPSFRGRMAPDQGLMRKQMSDRDVILLVGGEFFEEIWWVDESPFPPSAKLIQIEPAPARIARNYPVDCGLVSDPKRALEALAEAIEAGADRRFHARVTERMRALQALKEAERAEQLERVKAMPGNRPMSSVRLMYELARCLPEEVSIAGEAITASVDLVRALTFDDPSDYLAARGGGIGQGLPSAIGLKLAHPDRPVMCLSGDGSALYTIQALWTAAHHDIPIVFVIINNRAYRILKLNLNRYRSEASLENRGFLHLDLTEPEVDFVQIARGFGVEGQRIEAPEEIAPAVTAAFRSGKPWLLDVVVDGSV